MSIILTGTMCLALNAYHEARSASLNDQVLVSKVAIARSVNSANECEAVFKKGQFSWTSKYRDKKKFNSYDQMLKYYDITDSTSWQNSIQAAVTAKMTFSKSDQTIMFYHDNSIKKFNWSMSNLKTYKVTQYFVFYKVV